VESSQTPSWRFSADNSQLLHLALFVRDAAMLDIRPSPDMPPQLAWDLPPHQSVVPAGQRAAAVMQWTEWWRRLLDYEVNEARESEFERDDDAAYRAEMMASRHSDVFDPPDFESLAGTPVLQTAVRATFGAGLERYNEPSGQRLASFPWDTVRNAAESTAHERGVPLSRMRAVVHLLEVRGLWSYIAAPGLALCSSSIAADHDTASAFLQEVFSSAAS
jgi:hypothetical protein